MLDSLKQGVSVLALLSLVACGGGGGSSDTVTTGTYGSSNPTTTTTTDPESSTESLVKDLEVVASSAQLGSNSAEPVIISAMAKDINNNVLKEVEVQFAVDNFGTIEPDADTVGSSVKTARLMAGLSRPENRQLTVTVTADEQVRTLKVDVVGTTIQLEGPVRAVTNTATDYTLSLTDSTGQALANQWVAISASRGSLITPQSSNGFYTDAEGQLAFTLTAVTSGEETLIASALGTNYQHKLDVSGEHFVLSSAVQEVPVKQNAFVNLVWLKDGQPQVNRTLNLSATRGVVPNTVITNSTGSSSFSIRSERAGGTVITAEDPASGVKSTLLLEFVAITPEYLNIQTDKTNLAPGEQATIIALVRDEDQNPVKNQLINFNVTDGINSTLSSSTALTDSLGRAEVMYTAGNSTSAKDDVTISAWIPAYSAIATQTIHMTVGQRALRMTLGSDETVQESGIYYVKDYGVIVTDVAGNPVANQDVYFDIVTTHYHKGNVVCQNESWEPSITAYYCPTEDLNQDGWLDAGEDLNGNNKLDPGSAATVTAMVTTDANGRATAEVTYLQSVSLWADVRLVASIYSQGTEYKEMAEFSLMPTVSDMESCDNPTPNALSPFGVSTNCANPL